MALRLVRTVGRQYLSTTTTTTTTRSLRAATMQLASRIGQSPICSSSLSCRVTRVSHYGTTTRPATRTPPLFTTHSIPRRYSNALVVATFSSKPETSTNSDETDSTKQANPSTSTSATTTTTTTTASPTAEVQTTNNNDDKIPTAAKVLAYGGAIPFVVGMCGVLVLPDINLANAATVAFLQMTYAASIVSFLGAPHWGLAMAEYKAGTSDHHHHHHHHLCDALRA
jgi:hypothetical protein